MIIPKLFSIEDKPLLTSNYYLLLEEMSLKDKKMLYYNMKVRYLMILSVSIPCLQKFVPKMIWNSCFSLNIMDYLHDY